MDGSGFSLSRVSRHEVRQNGRGFGLGFLRGEDEAITDESGAAEHEHVNEAESGPAHHEEDDLQGRAVSFKVLCLFGVVFCCGGEQLCELFLAQW